MVQRTVCDKICIGIGGHISNFQNTFVSACDEIQGSHYFQIRGRSDFSFRELKGRNGRQEREVGRLLGEVNCD